VAGHAEIRAAEDGDIPSLNEIYAHYVRDSHVTFDVEPTTEVARRTWLGEHPGGRHRVVVAAVDGVVVAFASSSPYRPRRAYDTTVETSAYVAPDHLGRGLGSALYAELLRGLEGEDVHRAVAGIALPNDASVALHRRFGFERIGRFTEQGRKFGRYWDVEWYERNFA
jgi:phosphinothricin acetyltransferase